MPVHTNPNPIYNQNGRFASPNKQKIGEEQTFERNSTTTTTTSPIQPQPGVQGQPGFMGQLQRSMGQPMGQPIMGQNGYMQQNGYMIQQPGGFMIQQFPNGFIPQQQQQVGQVGQQVGQQVYYPQGYIIGQNMNGLQPGQHLGQEPSNGSGGGQVKIDDLNNTGNDNDDDDEMNNRLLALQGKAQNGIKETKSVEPEQETDLIRIEPMPNEENENEGQMDVDSVPGFEELERRFKALKNPI